MNPLRTESRRVDPNGRGYLAPVLFEGLTVVAEPCPTRESRSWPSRDGGPGVTYASHAIKLATGEYGRNLYILMEHGGGFECLTLRSMFNGEFLDALRAMPERLQYAALYSLWEAASEADRAARAEVRAEWAQAFCDGRIKKSRAKAGRRTITIEPKP